MNAAVWCPLECSGQAAAAHPNSLSSNGWILAQVRLPHTKHVTLVCSHLQYTDRPAGCAKAQVLCHQLAVGVVCIPKIRLDQLKLLSSIAEVISPVEIPVITEIPPNPSSANSWYSDFSISHLVISGITPTFDLPRDALAVLGVSPRMPTTVNQTGTIGCLGIEAVEGICTLRLNPPIKSKSLQYVADKIWAQVSHQPEVRERAHQCQCCNLIGLLKQEARSCKIPDWFWHHTLTDGIILLPCISFYAGVGPNLGLNLLKLTFFVLEFNCQFLLQRFCGACRSDRANKKIYIFPDGMPVYTGILADVERVFRYHHYSCD